MKNITTLFVSAIFMVITAFGANASNNTPAAQNKQEIINKRINTLIGNPTELLHGTDQSVMISYEVDDNNIMHIKDIGTSNIELKEYIIKRLDGKRFKHTQISNIQGIVKVNFADQSEQNYYFQY